ncbi:MAG: hypothetical protein WC321_01650 [Candidatus Omnitrophota bacterium]|jgi:hypothetical protein
MKRPKQSLTLVELLIATSIIATIVLGVNAMQIGLLQMFNKGIYRALLFQSTSYAMELMVREVEESNSVIVPAAGTSFRLFKKPPTGSEVTSEYYLDSIDPLNKKLCYRPDITQPADFQLILPYVQTFNLEGLESLGAAEIFRGIRITLEAQDPNKRADKSSYLQSLAFCRIPKGAGLVRVVDASRTTIKAYYAGIQEAIDAASNSDIVQVSSNDKQPYVESIVINKSLTLEGAYDNITWSRHLGDSNYETIIDGNRQGSVITSSHNYTGNTAIDGFTIQNGMSANGAGIFAQAMQGPITIINNSIKDNTSGVGGGIGGGIWAFSPGLVLTISNNIITGNFSERGGGIFAIAYEGSGFVISGNTFLGNSAYDGGAITAIASNDANLTISGNSIGSSTPAEKNSAYLGGGLSLELSDTSSINITNNSIIGNEATSGEEGGGGICAAEVRDNSHLNIANNLISGNSTSYRGGGIAVYTYGDSSVVDIFNNIIAENNASAEGGGILAMFNNESQAALASNIISGNSSGSHGGGIYTAIDSDSSCDISNNFLKDNGQTSGTEGATGGIRVQNNDSGGVVRFYNNTVTSMNPGTAVYTVNNGSLDLFNNIITQNQWTGIVIGCSGSGASSMVSNNIITSNSAGGIYASVYSSGVLNVINNTITQNTVSGSGDGIDTQTYASGKINIINTICYGNPTPASTTNLDKSSDTTVTYSDVGDLAYPVVPPDPPTPPGNIRKAPVYADAAYHLAVTGNEYIIDGGNPTILDPDSSRSDMGAYGGPRAANPMGFRGDADAKTSGFDDDYNGVTPNIREDIIGPL